MWWPPITIAHSAQTTRHNGQWSMPNPPTASCSYSCSAVRRTSILYVHIADTVYASSVASWCSKRELALRIRLYLCLGLRLSLISNVVS